MTTISAERLWVQAWLAFIFLLAPLHLLLNSLNIDAFLVERTATLASLAIMLGLVILGRRLIISRSQAPQTLAALFLTLLTAATTTQNNLAPVAFFSFTIATLILNQNFKPEKILTALIEAGPRLRKILFITYALLLAALISGLDNFFSLGNRFTGGLSSPTTFATWIITIHLISYADIFSDLSKSFNKYSLLSTAILLFLVIQSGTRINTIALSIILLAILYRKAFQKSSLRAVVIIVSLSAVLMIYDLYSVLATIIPSEILAFRYESGNDASFGLRNVLYSFVYENYINSSALEILFGLGGESSKLLIEQEWGANLLPHNDGIRIIHDYGIIAFFAFCVLITLVGKRSIAATVIAMLYIFSFIHNMAYTHYLIIAIILYTNLPLKNYDQTAKI